MVGAMFVTVGVGAYKKGSLDWTAILDLGWGHHCELTHGLIYTQIDSYRKNSRYVCMHRFISIYYLALSTESLEKMTSQERQAHRSWFLKYHFAIKATRDSWRNDWL